MIHEYASRIDANLWNDIEKIKQMDGGTTSINSLVNEGLKMVRDKKMEERKKIKGISPRSVTP